MTSGAPWSVKGIDPKAREVAKDLARRSGMTLGEWLNRMILEDDAPEEITSQSFFEERPTRGARAPRAAEAAGGVVREDLFSQQEGEGTVDSVLVDRLVQEKLDTFVSTLVVE